MMEVNALQTHCRIGQYLQMSGVTRKQTFWFSTRSDTNQAVQLQQKARDLKFRIYKVEGMNYLCSENKGTDQLRRYPEADLRLCFHIMQNGRFLMTWLKCTCFPDYFPKSSTVDSSKIRMIQWTMFAITLHL